VQFSTDRLSTDRSQEWARPEREHCGRASSHSGGAGAGGARPAAPPRMNDDSPVTGGNAELPAAAAPTRSRQPVPVLAAGERARASQNQQELAATGRRPWWQWLLIGLLVAISAGVTALFATTLGADLLQRHWAQAVDSSREAVPAAVGWGALFMVFFVGGRTETERRRPAGSDEVAATERQAAAEDETVRRAEERVQTLTVRLRLLAAGEPAEPASGGPNRSPSRSGPLRDLPSIADRSATADRSLARQILETSARLEQARQWLISAQAALAATRETAASVAGQRDRDQTDSDRQDRREGLPGSCRYRGKPGPKCRAARRIVSAASAAARAVITFVCAVSRSPRAMQLDATATSCAARSSWRDASSRSIWRSFCSGPLACWGMLTGSPSRSRWSGWPASRLC
jgi:hypothetical protein